MTPNHTPGSGDIAERIRQAWLARNPEPERVFFREDPIWQTWDQQRIRLLHMLRAKAYESAVIQFLVPEGHHAWQVHKRVDGEGFFAVVYPKKGDDGIYANSLTPAEALLSAIEAATQKDPS